MTRNKDLAKNTLLLGFSKITTQLLLFLLIPIYTKFLNPEDFGAVDLTLTYITLVVPFLTIQLELAAFRFAIENRENDNKLSEILSTIFSLVIPITALVLLLFIITSLFININYVLLIVLNILASVISSILLQYTRGIGKNKIFAISTLVAGLTTITSSIIFIVLLGWDASSIIQSAALSNIAVSLFLLTKLKLLKLIKLKSVTAQTRKELLGYSLPLLPNNISWWILNVSDRTIISLFIGVAANGVYAIAYRLAYIPNFIFGIFNMSWSETSALNIKANDKNKYFSEIFNQTLKIYFCIAMLFLTLIAIAFPYIVGDNFDEAYKYIPILVLGGLAQGMIGMYSSIYLAEKKTKQVTASTAYAAVLNIIINLSLVKFIGVYASAISTFVAFLVALIHRHYDVQKYVKIEYDKNIFFSFFILILITLPLFYINIFFLNIISVVLVSTISILINRKFIGKIVQSLKNSLNNKIFSSK